MSLDAPMQGDDDGATSRLDSIGNEDDRLELVDDQATIFAAAKHLPERERQILFLRFGEDLTQTEIAERVGRLADAGLTPAAQVASPVARADGRSPPAIGDRPSLAAVTSARTSAVDRLRRCPIRHRR